MSSKKILCICPNPAVDTFLWMEEIKRGTVNRVEREAHFPGGKGIHVALAAAELGEEAVVLGFWAGATGDWLKENCRALNVKCAGPSVSGWNRINYTLRAESDWNETELIGSGPLISEHEYLVFCNDLKNLLPHAGAVVMSGSLPRGVPDDAYGTFIDLARKFSVPSWVDCSGIPLQQALQHQPFGLHLNRSELNSILPAAFEKKPAAYFLQFVQQVALTAGRDGLHLSTAQETIHAHCYADKEYSAVGSGDCLTAGLAVAYLRSLNLMETARLATACGSANCLREELGMLRRSDVEELIRKVEVNIL